MAKNQAPSTSDVTTKVKEWLLKEGFPFEMEVATTLLEKGFAIEQAVYYLDEASQKSREIDVVARTSFYSEELNISVTISCVVECKYARQRPWVLLTSRNNSRCSLRGLVVSPAVANDKGKVLLSNIESVDEAGNDLLLGPNITAYSALTAFKENNTVTDQAYAAPLGVATAARVLAAKDDKSFSFTKAMVHTKCGIWMPVVVLDGLLFSAALASGDRNAGLFIRPTNWARLLLRNPEAGGEATAVDVVTKDGLRNYGRGVQAALNVLVKKVEENPEAAKEFLAVKRLFASERAKKQDSKKPQD